MGQSCLAPDLGARNSADDGEEEPGGQSAHQDAGQPLDRTEHPPLLRQHQITVPQRGVGDPGEIERRLGIRQALLPPVEHCPHRNLGEMQDEQPPRHPDEQPGHRPEPRVGQSVDPCRNIADSPAAWIVTVRARRHHAARIVQIIARGLRRSYDRWHRFASAGPADGRPHGCSSGCPELREPAFTPEKIGDRDKCIDQDVQEHGRRHQGLGGKVRPGQQEGDAGVT